MVEVVAGAEFVRACFVEFVKFIIPQIFIGAFQEGKRQMIIGKAFEMMFAHQNQIAESIPAVSGIYPFGEILFDLFLFVEMAV